MKTALFDWSRVDAMTDEEVRAAAMQDPDAQPMTDAEWDVAPKLPLALIIHRALGLTQEEFAARYLIPLDTLRDWELGQSAPDQTARGYLRAVAGDPVAVQCARLMTPQASAVSRKSESA